MLDTLGLTTSAVALAGPMAAHPKVDPATGELLLFGDLAVPPYLRYYVADASGALLRTVDIDLPAPVMMHDFVVTDRHVVFFDAPAVFDFARPLPVDRCCAGSPSWAPASASCHATETPRDLVWPRSTRATCSTS